MACIHAILSGDGGREPQERDQRSQQLAGGECELGFHDWSRGCRPQPGGFLGLLFLHLARRINWLVQHQLVAGQRGVESAEWGEPQGRDGEDGSFHGCVVCVVVCNLSPTLFID